MQFLAENYLFSQIINRDPKNLEIRTMSVEKTLEPLVLQVTTLVNSKSTSKKKKGESDKKFRRYHNLKSSGNETKRRKPGQFQ